MSALDEYMLQNASDSPIYHNIDSEELEELEITEAENTFQSKRED